MTACEYDQRKSFTSHRFRTHPIDRDKNQRETTDRHMIDGAILKQEKI